MLGPEAGEGELEGRSVAQTVHVRVDAGHEALGDAAHPRAVARPLDVQVAAVAGDEPGQPVALHPVGAEQLREPALGLPPPQLHLEEPVLGLHVALGEEQVVFVAA